VLVKERIETIGFQASDGFDMPLRGCSTIE